ncbi:hypothetical protein BD310DRAFT_935218 [Dichomitus squalens]|uniref:Uncharacterized protein n=1 Tax=Dichomitus squalens TaxID=114155 RepID=A0A4Q9PKR5_9APHY|nr:hypothetical protein BD310DRAFT_935218 [Dichomitus squalens]
MLKFHTLKLSASQLRALHTTGTLDRRLLHPLEAERCASLPPASHALETLAIPDECLPSDVFCSAQFPLLRDVSLTGRRGVWASLAGELHTPHTPGRQPIWPASSPCATLPWQRLRYLSVSYPDPEDEVYSHLPTTLRSLALRCWPRHYLHTLPHDAEAMNWMG